MCFGASLEPKIACFACLLVNVMGISDNDAIDLHGFSLVDTEISVLRLHLRTDSLSRYEGQNSMRSLLQIQACRSDFDHYDQDI